MRARFSEALMGIGGIMTAFGVTVIIIGYFAHRNTNTQAEFPAILSLATLSVVAGVVLLAAGYLLHRMTRDDSVPAAPRRSV